MRASDRAYAVLRDEIVDGTLAPGSPLAEVEQSTRLGVSRTPIREAFSRLLADGLVIARSPRVLVVAELSEDRIREVYELREALETHAAALAARRAAGSLEFLELRNRLDTTDPEGRGDAYFAVVDALDAAIDRAVANPIFSDALANARLHSARIRRLSQHDPARLRAAAEEHLLVVDAILAGDAALAAHATHIHLHRSLRSALERARTSTTDD